MTPLLLSSTKAGGATALSVLSPCQPGRVVPRLIVAPLPLGWLTSQPLLELAALAMAGSCTVLFSQRVLFGSLRAGTALSHTWLA